MVTNPNYQVPVGKLRTDPSVPDVVILSDTVHPTTPGVRIIEYKIPAFDGRRLTSGTLKGLKADEAYVKTIYDPTIWTDVKLKKALMEAMADKMRSAEGIELGFNKGKTIEFHDLVFYYSEENKVTTFFFE